MEKSVHRNWVSLKNGDEVGCYFRKDDKIYVRVNAMRSEELKNVDLISFRVNKTFDKFGRDKKHIWFISQKLSVDVVTWDIISQSYHKDKTKVYCGSRELPDADPKTFKVIQGAAEWGVDERSVYSQWFKLENSDPQTFQFIDDSFSKDKNNVYFHQNRLEGADPKSFEVIHLNVGKDKNAIFAFGKKLPVHIDRSSIRVSDDGCIYDKNGRYYLYKGQWIKDKKKYTTGTR